MVSTVSVPEANRLVQNREIKHYTEINYGIVTDSLFPGTIAIWVDREPPPDWINLPRREIGAIYVSEVRKQSYGQVALTDWADGRHTVYVDVDHPEDETWFGHIVIDDDTLAGVIRVGDINFNQHLKIDVVTRGGVVISSTGLREMAKQRSTLPVPDVLNTAVDVASDVRSALTDFFGSLVPQEQRDDNTYVPPTSPRGGTVTPAMEDMMPPTTPVAPPPSTPEPVPLSPIPGDELDPDNSLSELPFGERIRRWLAVYQAPVLVIAAAGTGIATVVYWLRDRGGRGI